MNIFVLDEDIKICAQNYCNRHMKIIIEIAQLACQARREMGDKSYISYKKINQGKKIIEWLKKNPLHYHWTIALGEELSKEYTYRYSKIHATSRVIQECKEAFFAGNIPNFSPVSVTSPVYNMLECPALAMPDEFKVSGDAVNSYRRYYALDKFYNIEFHYKKRPQPKWIEEIQKNDENQKIIQRYIKSFAK